MDDMIGTRELLLGCEFFRAMQPATLDLLSRQSQLIPCERGDYLWYQGDEATVFAVVGLGRLRLVQLTGDGKSVTMATFGPGEVSGMVAAMLARSYPGSLEAVEDSLVLLLPATAIHLALARGEDVLLPALRTLAFRMNEAHNRIRELSAERAEVRIAQALCRLAEKFGAAGVDGCVELDMRLSRQDLAELCGTTLETVSRTLRDWERDAIVDLGRERVCILQPARLAAIIDSTR